MNNSLENEKLTIVENIYDNVEKANRSSNSKIKGITEIFRKKFINSDKVNAESIKAITQDINDSLKTYNDAVAAASLDLIESLSSSFKKFDNINQVQEPTCNCKIDERTFNNDFKTNNHYIRNREMRIVCKKCNKLIDRKIVFQYISQENMEFMRSLTNSNCLRCGSNCSKKIPCGCIICSKCICADVAVETKRFYYSGKDSIFKKLQFDCKKCQAIIKLDQLYDVVDSIEILSHLLRVYTLKTMFPKEKERHELCCMKCFRNFKVKSDPNKHDPEVYCRSCYE